jgi:hypothetical protein
MSLLDQTLKLLLVTSLRPDQISAGAGVKLPWLLKVRSQARCGRKVNPRVTEVQKLHDFLAAATARAGENEEPSGRRQRRKVA